MSVDLIVATKGRRTPLERLFRSLVEENFKNFRVIVVDQNEPGYLRASIERYDKHLNILYLTSEPGLSRARNIGLEQAKAHIVAFPDDDCWYPNGLLEQVVRTFKERDDIGILMGRTVDQFMSNSVGRFLEHSKTIEKKDVWRAGNSASMFLRMVSLPKMPRFDESLGIGAATQFQSGEETDFLLRMMNAGVKAVFDPQLCVFHEQIDDRDADKNLERARKYAPGFGRVLAIHSFGLQWLIWYSVRPLLRAALALVVGDLRLARCKLVWVAAMLRGFFSSRNISMPASGERRR